MDWSDLLFVQGSVFVTFKTEEGMKKFLEAESVKYKDTELEKRLTKLVYYETVFKMSW